MPNLEAVKTTFIYGLTTESVVKKKGLISKIIHEFPKKKETQSKKSVLPVNFSAFYNRVLKFRVRIALGTVEMHSV